MDPHQLKDVALRHGIRLLVRFGSSVTGQMHSRSDIDLGVLVDHAPVSFGALADCLTDLQSLVPDREVDLVILNHADPLLLKQVTDHCVLEYGSPRELEALKLHAFKRYQDHRPYLDMERAYVDPEDRRDGAMTIDRDLITRKLVLIVGDLDPLFAIRDKGVDAYTTNVTDQAVVERRLERAVGRMIDINYHLITATGHPPPSDYHTSFVKLSDLGVLEMDFARRIARAAGLRNRIVHDYEDLDARKVFDALTEALHDVPAYLARINAHARGADA